MYTETKETIIERINRMADRFMNSGNSIQPECEMAIAKIKACPSLDCSLLLEKELLAFCDQKFPIDPDSIDSDLEFGGVRYKYTDADYKSPSQKIA